VDIIVVGVALVLGDFLLNLLEDAFTHAFDVTLTVEIVQHEGSLAALLEFEALQAFEVLQPVALIGVLQWNLHSLCGERPFVEQRVRYVEPHHLAVTLQGALPST